MPNLPGALEAAVAASPGPTSKPDLRRRRRRVGDLDRDLRRLLVRRHPAPTMDEHRTHPQPHNQVLRGRRPVRPRTCRCVLNETESGTRTASCSDGFGGSCGDDDYQTVIATAENFCVSASDGVDYGCGCGCGCVLRGASLRRRRASQTCRLQTRPRRWMSPALACPELALLPSSSQATPAWWQLPTTTTRPHTTAPPPRRTATTCLRHTHRSTTSPPTAVLTAAPAPPGHHGSPTNTNTHSATTIAAVHPRCLIHDAQLGKQKD